MENITMKTFYTEPVILAEHHANFFGGYILFNTKSHSLAHKTYIDVLRAKGRYDYDGTKSIVEIFAGDIFVFDENHYYPVPSGTYHEDILTKDGDIILRGLSAGVAFNHKVDSVTIERHPVNLETIIRGCMGIMKAGHRSDLR